MVWRNNTGAFPIDGPNGRRFFRAGTKGSSDLLGIVPRSGRLLAVEIKRPGKHPTDDQADFLRRVRESGGVGIYLSDPGRALEVIRSLVLNPQAILDITGDEF